MESTLADTLALAAELPRGARPGRAALLLALLAHALHVGVAGEAAGAQTPVVAWRVVAEGPGAAGLAQTLVDIDAALEAGTSWLVALVTHAPGLPIQQRALGVGRAEDVGTRALAVGALVGLGAHAHLLIAAESIARTVAVLVAGLHVETLGGVGGVGDGAGRAAALVAAGQVLAGPAEAAGGDGAALVDVDAADLGVAGVAGLALAQVAAGQVGAHAVVPAGARLAALVHVHAAGGNVGGVVGPAGLTLAVGLLVLK